ncbi:hypothetical protein H7J87_15440 [Mycolicibacterium wolinskyi]|uniref:CU044_2847 family protein n=1 Tax=Mycolicibacterium TaxID=1866885 RepID=UPI0010546264|nr:MULTISPECIES: CU044_2847 family protein [Mycolicibacterium]MCV7286721.1 hypothetical protein [Mycolicibacterium wolinskyi]MCV7293701.1 hypothetical protein [Mycolicibacterium goodii]
MDGAIGDRQARIQLSGDRTADIYFTAQAPPGDEDEGQQYAGLAQKVVTLTQQQAGNALRAAAAVVVLADTEFKAAGLGGTSASIEMGLDLTVGGDVKIAQGSAKSTLKVKLDWTI